jgi:hypothetical protein
LKTVEGCGSYKGKFVPFQPFGYWFEVQSPCSPSAVKAAIRARKKTWLDPKKGARGWIVGPFICLWFSALDRYGPMLFAKISPADVGTRVAGRAGSDLNGLALYTLLLPVFAVIIYQVVSTGEWTSGQVGLFGGLILLSPLIYWSSHKGRREAEPLVRFIRDSVTGSVPTGSAKTSAVTVPAAFTMDVGGEEYGGPVTPEAIHDALLNVGLGDFVILQEAPERYIQTAFRDGGYLLEKRDGDSQRHFEGFRRNVAPADASDSLSIFSFEEVHEAFISYATGAQVPHFLLWKPMRFPG